MNVRSKYGRQKHKEPMPNFPGVPLLVFDATTAHHTHFTIVRRVGGVREVEILWSYRLLLLFVSALLTRTALKMP